MTCSILFVTDVYLYTVPCGARLVALLSVLKNLFEREASQKVNLEQNIAVVLVIVIEQSV